MNALPVALLMVAVTLAGCSGGEDTQTVVDPQQKDPSKLKAGTGAIAGLLLDDRYRPIADGTVLVEQTGQTTKSNADGEFYFVDLDPGTYRLRAQVAGHEALPVTILVKEGVYEEQRLIARRVVNQDGSIITREYSVFVPCAISVPAASLNFDCTGDASGDTFRSGFNSDFQDLENITYLVTEMKANAEASPERGAYKVVVRERGNGQYYASQFIVDGDYMRLVMKLGERSADDTENRNSNWTNDRALETLLFPQGSFKDETQFVVDTQCGVSDVCFESRGLGPQFGVRAQFVQSLFIGEPQVDIETYRTF